MCDTLSSWTRLCYRRRTVICSTLPCVPRLASSAVSSRTTKRRTEWEYRRLCVHSCLQVSQWLYRGSPPRLPAPIHLPAPPTSAGFPYVCRLPLRLLAPPTSASSPYSSCCISTSLFPGYQEKIPFVKPAPIDEEAEKKSKKKSKKTAVEP